MPDPIKYAAAAPQGAGFAHNWQGQTPSMTVVLAHTDTCLIPGVSAAGVSEELRPLTPAADAEVVLRGLPLSLPTLPSNPLGAPGPAGITRAAARLGEFQVGFVGVGLTQWPQVQHERIAAQPGGDIRYGSAVPDAQSLLQRGYELGQRLARETKRVILGESVPGGTTTALALLMALGYDAAGRVSGSMPGNAHALKLSVVREALERHKASDPIAVVAQLGDPMQPVVAGAALGAAATGASVLLAGGSQMLAVAALVKAVAGASALDKVAFGTTRWIVEDPAADVRGLAQEISDHLPILAANLNFATSRHSPLHAYERNMVKEGVGAGGACVAALLAGATLDVLHDAIDEAYEPLLAAASPTLDGR